MKFSELVRLIEREGFRLIKEKGSIRYYGKAEVDRLIRIDYHGAQEVPSGTCAAIL
jgi:predicted RNA binding protein YcfA (HicA-like mRNA interferase family)